MSESAQHEAQLLLRISRQDQDALAELYDLVSPTLYGIAYRMLGSDAEAEDILQDVLIRIWEKADCYDPRLGAPIAWLITLTRNRANDRLRSLVRRGRLHESLKTEEDAILPSKEPAAVTHLLSQETAVAVQDALKRLPSEQRQAIELAFLGGLTQLEVAERLSEPLGTIKARIRRGMLSLRELLPADWREGRTPLTAQSKGSGQVAEAE